MKLFALLSICAVAACTTQDVAPEQGAREPRGIALLVQDATDSVNWDPSTMGGNDIWPTGQGISTVQVLIKRGPDGSTGRTFLAFVVWNTNQVGKIFRVRVGDDGTSFRGAVSNITSSRTINAPDFNSSTSGNGGGGGAPPVPHPNIDGSCHFAPAYLQGVKDSAAAIEAATQEFLDLSAT